MQKVNYNKSYLNRTRLECKDEHDINFDVPFSDLNRTRLECKEKIKKSKIDDIVI